MTEEKYIHRRRLWEIFNDPDLIGKGNDVLVDFIGDWLSEVGLLPEEDSLLGKDSDVTRVDVIDHRKPFHIGTSPRAFSSGIDEGMDVELSYQDDGRTLKVFLRKEDT